MEQERKMIIESVRQIDYSPVIVERPLVRPVESLGNFSNTNERSERDNSGSGVHNRQGKLLLQEGKERNWVA